MNNRLPSPTTLRDIALAAGVSAPTVSRVLRGRPETRVSAKTKEKIFALAKEMNYHPNMLARSLKTQSTNILAFFLPNIASPVFPEVIRGAEKAASDNRFTLFLTELDKNALTSKRYLALLKDRIIDGLILAIAGEADVVINDLVEANAHFVLVNRMVSFSSNYVTVDDAAGVYIATAHLLDLGHKAVGYISGPLILDTACRRLEGYKKALSEQHIAYDEMLVEETKWSDYSAGRDAMLRLLKKTRPTAVIASNQTLAIGIQAALLESGLRIPQDMSVISYHDSPLASISVPPMTVVKMPLYEMGYRAAEALIHLIQGGESAVPIMLPPDGLVLRSSTCRPLAEI